MAINNWKVRQLRFTFFPETIIDTSNLPWPKLKGLEKQAESTDLKIGQTKIEGKLGSDHVTLAVSPLKFDLLIIPGQWFTINPVKVSSLAGFDLMTKKFFPLLEAFVNINNFPDVKRVGFGVSLFIPVQVSEEGYQVLDKYLPFKVNKKDSSDFLYQINRPKASKSLHGLKINRLSKWSVLKLKAEVGSLEMPTVSLTEIHFTSLELDINSPQELNKKFTKKEILSLFEEFRNEAVTISKKGLD